MYLEYKMILLHDKSHIFQLKIIIRRIPFRTDGCKTIKLVICVGVECRSTKVIKRNVYFSPNCPCHYYFCLMKCSRFQYLLDQNYYSIMYYTLIIKSYNQM